MIFGDGFKSSAVIELVLLRPCRVDAFVGDGEYHGVASLSFFVS